MDKDTTLTVEEIIKNLQGVEEKITHAAHKVGRTSEDIKLVVVTKTHSVEMIKRAIEAGAQLLGENYAEEGIAKKAEFSNRPDLQWHMIGHIQSRKARLVVQHYDYIHSLDSLKLAIKLSNAAVELQRQLPILLECNVSGEETKFGYKLWDKNQWQIVLDEIGQIVDLPNLQISGLMTMAPYYDNPEQARPVFQKLWQVQDYFSSEFPHISWKELSMGMSADYEIAIEEGATMVRIGQAILGSRLYC